MMDYRLIIFDFDGTLADSFGWAAGLVNQFADQYGFRRIEPHEQESLRSLDAKTLIQHLGVPAWKIPIMAAHVRKLMGQQIDRIPLFEGIGGQLRCLAAGGATLAARLIPGTERLARQLAVPGRFDLRKPGSGRPGRVGRNPSAPERQPPMCARTDPGVIAVAPVDQIVPALRTCSRVVRHFIGGHSG